MEHTIQQQQQQQQQQQHTAVSIPLLGDDRLGGCREVIIVIVKHIRQSGSTRYNETHHTIMSLFDRQSTILHTDFNQIAAMLAQLTDSLLGD